MNIQGDPFVCGTCGRRFPEKGSCTSCGDPLLDARSDEVRQMLIDDDARRAAAAFKRWLFISIPLGLGVVVFTSIEVPTIGATLLMVPFLMGYAMATAGVAVLLTAIFQRLLPAKKLFAWLA